MKKIGLLLAAALIALSVMGCANPHTDKSWDVLTPPCFNSSQGNKAITYVMGSGTATGTVTFTYSSATEAWGKAAGVLEFGICSDTSWTTKYTGASLTVGGGYKACTMGAGTNNSVSGLVEGKTYTVTIKSDASTVQVKID